MEIGVIGLGRMGGNIVRRLLQHGHHVVCYDQNRAAVVPLAQVGAEAAADLEALVAQLAPPRAVWIMLPAGRVTDEAIATLSRLMQAGDTIIDGGNTFWQDDIRRADELKPRGIHYVDVGTSGGIWGFERGYCMMIGGEDEVIGRLDPVFSALAPGIGDAPRTPHRDGRDPRVEQGYVHAGPVGAGHYVKMVHNGIEYGLMQAYAEGFDILRNAARSASGAAKHFDIDVADIAEVWRRGSVISSWLLDLTAAALAEDPKLEAYSGYVEDSGEGRWTIMAAVDQAVPADVLAAALNARFRSREQYTFGDKMLSAMRKGFGGHVEGGAAPQRRKAS